MIGWLSSAGFTYRKLNGKLHITNILEWHWCVQLGQRYFQYWPVGCNQGHLRSQIIEGLIAEENKNPVNQFLDKRITTKEVRAAIGNLKSKKAVGIDGMCIELLKTWFFFSV